MARTLLAAEIRSRIAATQPMGPRAITRRAMIAMTAAAAACSAEESPVREADMSTVAVIGGGVSGLVTAWRLALAGIAVEVFEASGRMGGRMHTLRNFTPEGQFCELGGEFVDAGDAALIRVCGELGVGIERIRADRTEAQTLYDIGKAVRTDADLLDPAMGTGAFIPVAARIATDQAALLDARGNWTERAHELDALPLSSYLDSLRPTSEQWVIDLIALAWQAEFGVPVKQQSSLNLVDTIGADASQPFSMMRRRTGALRIGGGSASLTEALQARLTSMPLAGRVSVHMRHELASIRREAGGINLSFRTESGPPVEKIFPRVVMALPFSRVRALKGLGGLALPADKMKVIAELGYGAQAKLAVGMERRPPTRIYSDRGFQSAWDGSAGQAGNSGVLVNMFAGARSEEAQALDVLTHGLAAIDPQAARALTPKVRASFFWGSHPHSKGSRAVCLTGQYTSYAEIAARTELDGRLAFAGEHTSAAAMGTMNGAVEAGERAARQLSAGG